MPELYDAKTVRYPDLLSAFANYWGVEDVDKEGTGAIVFGDEESKDKSLRWVIEDFFANSATNWIFSRKDPDTSKITIHYFVNLDALPVMLCGDFAKVLEGAFPYVPNNEYVAHIAQRAYELTQEALAT